MEQKISHWEITNTVSQTYACTLLHRISQSTARAQARGTSYNLHRINEHPKNEAPGMGWVDRCHTTDEQADGRAIGGVSDMSRLRTRRHRLDTGVTPQQRTLRLPSSRAK